MNLKSDGFAIAPPGTSVDYGSNLVPPPTASGGSGAPVDATYVVMSLNGTLTQERKLTAGTDIMITDGGANGNVTIGVTSPPTGFNWGKSIADVQGLLGMTRMW